eukprot:SAG25_NODE_646_length_6216_cov_14.594736_1_plen_107_part_00
MVPSHCAGARAPGACTLAGWRLWWLWRLCLWLWWLWLWLWLWLWRPWRLWLAVSARADGLQLAADVRHRACARWRDLVLSQAQRVESDDDTEPGCCAGALFRWGAV